MNQILVTGYEKVKKPKQKLGIKYNSNIICNKHNNARNMHDKWKCICKNKINETVEANAKPIAEINRNDDDNTVESTLNT